MLSGGSMVSAGLLTYAIIKAKQKKIQNKKFTTRFARYFKRNKRLGAAIAVCFGVAICGGIRYFAFQS